MSSLYLMDSVELTGNYTKGFDCFIFCGGPDERFCSVIRSLRKNGIFIKKSYAFQYSIFRPFDDKAESCIQSFKSSILTINEDGDFRKMISALDVHNDDTIGIDITGFETPDLLSLLYFFKSTYPEANYFYFYAEPYHYHFNASLFDDTNFRSGNKAIKYVTGYVNAGVEAPDTLVIFLGFEKYTSSYVNEQVEPRETYAIYGIPSYLPKLKDVSLANNFDLLSAIDMKDHIIGVTANNPFDSYNMLDMIKNRTNSESLISICPLGTHPMSLGAGLFALDNAESTKIIFPYCCSSTIYPAKGTSNVWVYKSDLA